MKIEWLNHEMTEARIIVGWFRKRMAHVVFQPSRYTSDRWNFKMTGNHIGWWHSETLNVARNTELARRAGPQEWQPVRELPPARLVKP